MGSHHAIAWAMCLGWGGAPSACTWSGDDAPIIAPGDEDSRSDAMQNHQVAVHRARDAVIAQDLDGVRRAGERLAVEREIPLLPPPALRLIEQVRAGGGALAEARDLDDAAEQVVELTRTCSRCHTILEVPPKVPLQATQRDLLWTALVFRSEQHWSEGARRDPILAELRYWEDRRLALVLRMQGGEL